MRRVRGSKVRSAGSKVQPAERRRDGGRGETVRESGPGQPVTGTAPSEQRDRRSVRVTITNQPAGSDSAVAVVDGADSTCQFVDYATPVVQDLVNSLSEGAVVTVDLERVHGRGNCWRVLGVHAVAEKGSGSRLES